MDNYYKLIQEIEEYKKIKNYLNECDSLKKKLIN